MTRPRLNPVKVLPSLADLAVLLPVAFLFARLHGTKALLGDCDTGWHLRTGEWILANRQVPHTDIFSFTRPGQPWFAWEWLWDVLFAGMFQAGGLQLVVVAHVLLLAGIFLLLYKTLCHYATPLVALPVMLTAAVASSIHWLARPHLFTLLFSLIFFRLLERVRGGERKWLWALPVITVLWTNLHGGFFVGMILIGGYAVGEWIGGLLAGGAAGRAAWKRSHGYLAAAGGCLAASLVNPYYFQLHAHVFQYLTDSYEKEHIIEFLSLNFQHPVAPFFELLLLAGACAAVWQARRGNWTATVLIGVWAHGALLSARNIPLFALATAPYAAEMLEAALRQIPHLEVAGWLRRAGARFLQTADGLAEMERIGRWHLVTGLGLALVAALVYAPTPPQRFRAEFDPAVYPVAALQALNFGRDARIFANDEWGDYLIYRLYPKGMRVFVDGRSDFYGREFEEKYLDAYGVKYGWEQTLRRYGIDNVLLPTGAALAGALKESSRWRVVYDDGTTLVFRPADAAQAAAGTQVSGAPCGGIGRGREITKTQARDHTITEWKHQTTI